MRSTVQSRSSEQVQSPLPPACVPLINDFLGVGKFTIAKSLCSSLITSNTPYRLLDNHLIIDTAHPIIPDRSPSNYAMRKQFRKVAFDALKALEEEKLVVVLTACLVSTDDDLSLFEEYFDIAESRKVPLFMVNHLCDMRTNISRLESEGRKANGKTKLVDGDVLENISREGKLLDRETTMKIGKEIRGEALMFEIDSTTLSVEREEQKVWETLCEVKAE